MPRSPRRRRWWLRAGILGGGCVSGSAERPPIPTTRGSEAHDAQGEYGWRNPAPTQDASTGHSVGRFGQAVQADVMLISGELLAESAALPLEDSTTPAAKISREPLTTRARPADPPTWVANHEAVRRHILGHDGTGSNKGMLSDGQAADHHNPGAQSCPPLHDSRQKLCTMAFNMRPRAQVISESDSWTKEHIVADMHALEDHDLVFDGDAVADRCAVFHEGSIADVAVTANSGAC